MNLHIAQEFKIGFIPILRKHIYVAKCKWSRFTKSDIYPIREKARSVNGSCLFYLKWVKLITYKLKKTIKH